ncbi:Cytochrome oxidase assembly protein 1 [Senna tora]|uniref:Cytochrome oxidase assembly protein 1 n=1 Tax=Senna tora TaxID=362788 RepID=A0A834SL70_9FABA|nr:Cytochrome oxidase assembly protein 1 [Senna tora]
MLAKRFSSFLRSFSKPQISSCCSSTRNVDEETSKSFGRKAVSFVLITVTGGVALSALDDLAIYQGCSSKAMEKVSKNQAMAEALGEPIVKGPWYNASLAVANKRNSVSCTFPVSGPQGTGLLQLKAVRNGEDTWFSYFLPRDWEILIMDALLHVPGNEEKHQTMRINLADKLPTSCTACTHCPHAPQNAETKLSAKQ